MILKCQIMKQYFFAAVAALAGCLFFCSEPAAQLKVNKSVANLQKSKIPGITWYINAKKGFLQLQKTGSNSQVMARQTKSNGGFIEIGSAITDNDPVERVKGSSSRSFQEGKVICKAISKEIDLSVKPEFNVLKATSFAKIFPGMIFKSESILDESLVPGTNLPARKPLTLNISLPGTSATSVVLDQPGVVQLDRVNSLLTQNHGRSIPTMAGLSITEVDSRFSFAARIDASSGLFLPLEEFGIPAQVNAGAAFSGNAEGENKRKTYIVKYIQPMFFLSHNSPDPASIFQQTPAAGTVNNLVMVNSVTYGRMVFIRVVSEANAGQVKTALEGKLGIELVELNVKVGHNVEGSGSVSFSSVIKEFKALVIGGNGQRVISNPDQLVNYIQDPTAKNFGPNTNAVPISFTMVRVSDYASLGIRSVANFEAIEECKTMEKIAVYIKNFRIDKVVDNPLAGNNEDLFGTISVQAFYRNAAGNDVEIKDEQSRSAHVWNVSSSSPQQMKEGETHHMFVAGNSAVKDGVRRFLFSPEQLATGYIIIKYRIKDKIMSDGEQLGNSNSSVRYEEKDFRYPLAEWSDLRDVSGCTYTLKEVGGDAKICINFSKYRE